MNVTDALEKIGHAIESVLEKDEDAMTWDQENTIKKRLLR